MSTSTEIGLSLSAQSDLGASAALALQGLGRNEQHPMPRLQAFGTSGLPTLNSAFEVKLTFAGPSSRHRDLERPANHGAMAEVTLVGISIDSAPFPSFFFVFAFSSLS